MSIELSPGRLYGANLRSHKVASFDLSERVYPPGFKTPRHSHKRALFCFVVQGEYTETYGVRTRECKSSSLLFHPAGELHAECFHDTGGRSFIVEIEPPWMERVREHLGIEDNSIDLSGKDIELLARRLYKEFLLMDEASVLIIEGMMLEIVGEAARRFATDDVGRQSPRWLRQAKELLRDRFTERLTLEDVAKTVGVHPVHLAQTFHKNYRCTVGDFVRRLRIEYACRELAVSELPIVDIALAAGFCDQSHFTRTFKRCTGVPPSQYRGSFRRE
ncbi:MAG TPA: AraC family transcriptional regulator [Blastocatellia bacterium]|nr:AraC family transcriptional regulator [Blastocatellia bacterium]